MSPGIEQMAHLRVLVIDDDDDDAAITRRALDDIPWFTCAIDCTNSYGTALRAMREKEYDVILLDHGLGARSGLELLEEAFGNTLPVAVVLLTGMASHKVDEAASRAGIAHLLEKSELKSGQLERSVRYALERTRIERELRDSSARHQLLFNCNPSPLWVADEESKQCISANAAALAQYGYTLEEFLTLTAYDICVADSKDEIDAIWAAQPTGLTMVGDVQHRTKTGHLIDVDVVLHSIELDGRRCQMVLATDITERKHAARASADALALAGVAREQLEFERNRLSGIFAQAPAFMAVLRGKERIFEMVNEELIRLAGRNPLGRPAAEAIPEVAEQGLFALVDRVRETALPYVGARMPVTIHDQSGEARALVLNFVLQPLEEADGVVSGVLVHGVDVTKEVASADALRQSEEQYRTLVELSPDGILIHVNGNIVFANGSAARILGAASPADLLGRAMIDLVHPDESDRGQARLERLWRGELLPPIEARWLTMDGVVRDMNVSSLSFEFGGLLAVHTVFRDTTGQRHLEEQLRQAQKMEAVGQLAGGVAHDFNNLLTVIKGSAEFLLEDLTDDSPHRADVIEVREAADRAAALTRQLLAFSRKQILQSRVLDVNSVVASVKPMLSRLIREDVIVETRLAPQVGSIVADPGQLEQVLINLVVNARDAMPKGGRLLIETAQVTLAEEGEMEGHSVVLPGPYVVLSVSDTGTGMTPEVRARIFEPFFTTKPVGQGTGLGLATVYGIVQQSGGHLRVETNPGHGSMFEIFLPVVHQALTASQKVPVVRSTTGIETILLVEDMDAVREIAERVLSRDGYTVLQASNGKEALDIARGYESPIHLLLSDVVMPEMNGLQLADALKPLRPDIVVLFMSGYAEDEATRRGIEQARAGFVAKPFSPLQLLHHVRQALNG